MYNREYMCDLNVDESNTTQMLGKSFCAIL